MNECRCNHAIPPTAAFVYTTALTLVVLLSALTVDFSCDPASAQRFEISAGNQSGSSSEKSYNFVKAERDVVGANAD